jgi:hypothetical protein
MEHFKNLIDPLDSQPKSQSLLTKERPGYFFSVSLIWCVCGGKSGVLTNQKFARDQLNLSSWLALGACANTLLFLAIGRLALIPPFLLLGARFGNALLMVWGFKKNPYMDGVVRAKFSGQLPNEDGTFGPKPADQQVVVFMIGAKCNQ